MTGVIKPVTTFADQRITEWRTEVRTWLEGAIPAEWSERRDAIIEEERVYIRRDWERILGRGGYACLDWPLEFGGRNLGVIENMVFFEEAASLHAPPELNQAGKSNAGPAIIRHGTPAQQAIHLPGIVSGETIWCEGFSEPSGGSDLAAVTTYAEWRAGEYHITGQKIWTSGAHLADRCYLLARTSRELPRHQNLTLFLLDMKQAGVSAVPIRDITGGTHFSEVYFDDARATRDEVLGSENEAWNLVALHGARRINSLVQSLRRYVQMKEMVDQLDACSVERGVDMDRLATLRVRLELMRWHARRVAELIAGDEDWRSPLSVMKLYWSELLQEIAESGLALNCNVHREYWRDRYLWSRMATIAGGTAQIQRNVIAERTLGLPR